MESYQKRQKLVRSEGRARAVPSSGSPQVWPTEAPAADPMPRSSDATGTLVNLGVPLRVQATAGAAAACPALERGRTGTIKEKV